ncbi:MAG: translation elongation factor Ts [Chitinispirillia bacterium]|nr:translation elongation factor Ts [Chitinispirillia bacterium]MCL2241132.1 translation elongation factor Ts [Chitinispirillia bacterium]
MEITASQVKELREKTGIGMMICKEALIKANGDMELAIEDLRKQGQATAAKRAGKAAKEGKVSIVMDAAAAMVYEVNAETDFVAKNEDFVAFIDSLGKILLAQKPADHAAALKLSDASIGSITVEAKVTELVGKIGEKIEFRRYRKMAADPSKEKCFSYIHGGGKIGVLIKIAASAPGALESAEVAELGKDLAMQIAAARPAAVDPSSIPAEVIAKEKEIYAAQAKESGKPEKVWDKMIEGKLTKYFEEFTLVNQKFIRDTEVVVKDRIAAVAKAVGADVKPVEFFRLELGESD